jgi:hypothetical protein
LPSKIRWVKRFDMSSAERGQVLVLHLRDGEARPSER